MVADAETRLGPDRRFGFRIANVQEPPFEGDSFDTVVANHMLYHVPGKEQALSEIMRVMKPAGTLYATTNGEQTHKEMGWMQRILDPSRPSEDYFAPHLEFSLENGAEQLSPRFSDVTLRRYREALATTEVEPMVEYLLSGSAAGAAQRGTGAAEFGLRVSDLIERLEEELASRGTIRVTKDTGLFLARK